MFFYADTPTVERVSKDSAVVSFNWNVGLMDSFVFEQIDTYIGNRTYYYKLEDGKKKKRYLEWQLELFDKGTNNVAQTISLTSWKKKNITITQNAGRLTAQIDNLDDWLSNFSFNDEIDMTIICTIRNDETSIDTNNFKIFATIPAFNIYNAIFGTISSDVIWYTAAKQSNSMTIADGETLGYYYEYDEEGNATQMNGWTNHPENIVLNSNHPYLWTYHEYKKTGYLNSEKSAPVLSGSYAESAESTTIEKIETFYATSDDGKNHPTKGWSDVPVNEQGKYIWIKTVTTYNDGQSYDIYQVTYFGKDGESSLTVEIISSNGNLFRGGNISTTLECHVYYGTEDVTNKVKKFNWKKIDANGNEDDTWSWGYNTNTLTISDNDVYVKASFVCDVEIDI